MNVTSGDFAFIPLGGTGEIGLNLNVYRCDGALLAIDCGIGFGGPENPEVEVMVPDPTWLAERRDHLAGLVITHAHEDHIGAVAALWRQLLCPIYGSPFVIAVLRRKLAEAGLLNQYRYTPSRWVAGSRSGPSTLSSSASPIRCPSRSRWPFARATARCCIRATGSWTPSP